ncbi:MAG: hypothetical protein WCQ87_03110 [Parabacteroides sp.]
MDDNGDTQTTSQTIYSGMMDESMNTPEVGETAQTSNYIVTIPLTIDAGGKYIIPKKDDKIMVVTYDEVIPLVVENGTVSQLGGITINASRGDW